MARRKVRRRKQRKPEDEYTYLAVRVERYEASAGASINHDVYQPQYAFSLDDCDPLYRFSTQLTITGTSTYPEERAGDLYELTIYGDDRPSARLHATLKDVQVRDESGVRQYRTYGGMHVPVYNPPSGLGPTIREDNEPNRQRSGTFSW
jgi:hypothetical protein